MARRLTRREIKRDEVLEGLGSAVTYIESHRRALYWIGGLLAAAGLAAWGIVAFFGGRAERAQDALARAIQVAGSPVAGAGARPDDAAAPSFPDAAARRARARELFESVRSAHGWSEAAGIAGFYLGSIAAEEGRFDDARALWREFAEEHEGHFLAAEARLNLIGLDRRGERAEQVADELRRELASDSRALPEDVLLRELAVTLELMGRGGEAMDVYQRIVDEHPQSPYYGEAVERTARAAEAG